MTSSINAHSDCTVTFAYGSEAGVYTVYGQRDGGEYIKLSADKQLPAPVAATNANVTLSSLADGQWNFKIQMADLAGNAAYGSEASTVLAGMPAGPTGLDASYDGAAMTLNWTKSKDDSSAV